MPNQVVCSAQYTYENLPVTTTSNREVRFNSTTSATVSGDSIISRKWTFGDGTTATTTNKILSHVYAQPGTYTVCLTITTALGCSKTECKTVIVTQVNSACVPHFTWVRTAPKQVSFNSSTSWVPLNDTIIERKWNFGDASSILAGNVVSPVHNYLHNGIYTVSMRMRTSHNCEQTYTVPVIVQDSTVTPPTVEPIKIISIYPNPATIQTQTVVWSQYNNIQAELAVYDVYGSKKWSITKVLLQGNNITVVPTALLMPGPYYFRVTTIYGSKSRPFFKHN
jgi:PKD repeat protein